MSLRDDLFRLLSQTSKNQSEIKLLNVYKGIPISFVTSINSVGNFEISVPVSKQKIASLYHQRETYLLGEELPFMLRSQVISLNLAKDNAILANFEVAKPGIGKRAQVRVEPDEPLIALIRFINSGYELVAPISDISSKGASIAVESYLFSNKKLIPGNEIMVSISFSDILSQKIIRLTTKPLLRTASWPDGIVTITARGKIVSIFNEPYQNNLRAGMRLSFQDLARTVVSQYISQRQAEIIRDLRVLSEELYRRKK